MNRCLLFIAGRDKINPSALFPTVHDYELGAPPRFASILVT